MYSVTKKDLQEKKKDCNPVHANMVRTTCIQGSTQICCKIPVME